MTGSTRGTAADQGHRPGGTGAHLRVAITQRTGWTFVADCLTKYLIFRSLFLTKVSLGMSILENFDLKRKKNSTDIPTEISSATSRILSAHRVYEVTCSY